VNRSRAASVYARLGLSRIAAEREEKGIALPIVLAILAIGAMIVSPFLTHAGANLIGSRVYADISKEQFATEGGIEQAIWDLKYGTLVSRLNAAGGTLSYNLGNSLNGIAPAMTVAQTGTGGGGGTAGTITQPYTNRYQWDTAGYNPVIVNVSGTIYAIAYRNAANDVILKTVNISNAGAITQSILSSLTVDTTGYEPDILKISSGVVALIYRGTSNKGYIATVQINSSGIITGTPTSAQICINNNAYEPSIIPISGEYYGVAYRGASNKGYVQTLRINSAGVVLNNVVSNYSFSATCYEPSMTSVSGNYYAVAFRGSSNLGYLTTLNISTLGVITQTVVSSQSFTATVAYTPNLRMTAAGVAGIVFRGTSNRGYITTLAINSSGIISTPALSTFIFDSSAGYEPFFRNISGTAFAVFYRGASNRGNLKTLTISSAGSISSTPIDSYVFDTASGYEPHFMYITGNTYAAVYRGGAIPNTTGYVITLQIATNTAISYQIQAVAGATTATAILTINNGSVSITSWNISR
jgi:hypothetical protein